MEFHQAETQDRRGRRLTAISILVVVTLLASAWVGLFGFLGANAASGTLETVQTRFIPDVDNLDLLLPRVSELSEVYTADGVRLGFLTERNSQPVALSDVPDTVLSAVLAAEDADFFNHKGIDFKAIARAAVEQLQGGPRQGGSTITQQVVKQNFGSSELTIERKIHEAVIAAELERRYTKEEIIEFYVNSVFFGSNAYGVKAAAQEFFGKSLDDVTIAEAAAMVTAIRNPTRYDMRDNPAEVLRARNGVIANMVEKGFITPDQGAAARAEPLVAIPHQTFQELAPQVMIEVRNQLTNDEQFGLGASFAQRKQALFGCAAQDKACEQSGGLKGGLKVYTTLDYRLQGVANQILRDSFPVSDTGPAPTGAIAMVDNRTGAVRVMASGLDFGTNIEAGQRPYDIAGKGRRNPGSSFKPIGLAAALESGQRFGSPITLGTYWSSASPQILDYPGAPKPWECNNAGGGGGGLRSLEDGTVFSTNTVYCQVAIATGAEKIVEMAHRLGIESDIEAVPSIVLGSQAVTPLEMAAAYSTFANYGIRAGSYLIERIEDSAGNVIYQHEPDREQVLEPAEAAAIVRTLEQVVSRGTGTAARIGRPQAGKTGTHQNYTDVWFMGFIPQFTTAVWVGFPDAQIPMKNITINGTYYSRAYGGTLAAPVWKKFMTVVTDGLPVEDFPPDPPGMAAYYVVPRTEVPDVSGLTAEAAKTKIEQAGLNVAITEVFSDQPAGEVILITPEPGTRISQGATVDISVSRGIAPSAPMPSVIGLTLAQADQVIEQFKAANGVAIHWIRANVSVPNPAQYDVVVRTAPDPGTLVEYDQVVTLYVGVP